VKRRKFYIQVMANTDRRPVSRLRGPLAVTWRVVEDGRVRATYGTKKEAIGAAAVIARECEPSQVLICKLDGSFQEERRYGADPYPPKG
jgi:hypothetical protein